ncbi:MAG: ketoacyl-ACP synthase III [Prevotellaceae bacterium]|jgi:3-oxoacyl-[acyl-carrier-protein] synthase-3|nr:ketoacyl-ACP synthase III [Prevotellaceae bacterium]
MNILQFKGISISAISACVPKTKINNREFGKLLFDEETLAKTIDAVGVEQRRVTEKSVTTSDLCFAAAEQLFAEQHIDKSEIDVLIFVSQTPDYRLPATACVLQNRLGLSKKTIAFDVNLGCSGYVYGLSAAYAFANIPTVQKVLLLAGDTPTKFVSPQDKSAALLFGDAGTATLLEKSDDAKDTFFNLFTDGSGFENLNIKGGGYRCMSNAQSFETEEDTEGNLRNSEQLYMNGGEIFNFTLREVPKSINELLEFSNINILEINQFVFHQANKFMINFLCKKMKIDREKFLISLNKFGNTSTASIPLTLVVNKNEHNYGQVLMSGFGVGLSWANAVIDLKNTKFLSLIEI